MLKRALKGWNLVRSVIASSMPPTRPFLVPPARPAITSIIPRACTSGSSLAVMLLAQCAAQCFKIKSSFEFKEIDALQGGRIGKMAKSKRSKIGIHFTHLQAVSLISSLVHLTKVSKKGREHKVKLFEQVQEASGQFQNIWVFRVENMRNLFIKQVRLDFSDSR